VVGLLSPVVGLHGDSRPHFLICLLSLRLFGFDCIPAALSAIPRILAYLSLPLAPWRHCLGIVLDSPTLPPFGVGTSLGLLALTLWRRGVGLFQRTLQGCGAQPNPPRWAASGRLGEVTYAEERCPVGTMQTCV
jgi:hypothetical protein